MIERIDMTDIRPEILAALNSHIKKLATASRDELSPGDYTLEGVKLVLEMDAQVSVGKPYPQRFTNSARPWSLVTILLAEVNKERLAAEKAGLNLATLVEMSESVDPELSSKAKAMADEAARELKEPTLKQARGKVRAKILELNISEV